MWDRSVRRDLAGRTRRAMHPEDALIYLVAYQSVHRGRLSRQMALDVATLLEAEEPSIEWDRVIREIDVCGLRLPLYHGFSYAREKGAAKIPTSVLDALRPPAPPDILTRLYQRLVTEQGVSQVGYFLLVFSRPGWKNKVKALWRAFFPSNEFLSFRYGKTNRWDRFWIRLSRPAYMGYHGSRLLLRMAYRLLVPSKV